MSASDAKQARGRLSYVRNEASHEQTKQSAASVKGRLGPHGGLGSRHNRPRHDEEWNPTVQRRSAPDSAEKAITGAAIPIRSNPFANQPTGKFGGQERG